MLHFLCGLSKQKKFDQIGTKGMVFNIKKGGSGIDNNQKNENNNNNNHNSDISNNVKI